MTLLCLKSLAISLILVYFSISSRAQFAHSDSIQLKANRLEKYYTKAISSKDSLLYQSNFFYEFPNDFNTFKEMYDYESNGILYLKYEEHVRGLFYKISVVITIQFICKIYLD